MTTTRGMGFAVVALAMAAGCSDDNNRLDTLTSAQQDINGKVAATVAQLDAEAAARKLGDVEALTSAKAYADGLIGSGDTGLAKKLDDEIARARGREAEFFVDAKAYTDQQVAKVLPRVTHMFAAQKGGASLDLGRHHGGAFAVAMIGGKAVDVWRDGTLVARAAGPNCTGDLYLDAPPRRFGADRYVFNGKVYAIKSSTAAKFETWGRLDGLGNCTQDGVTGYYVPLTPTGDTATAYDPLTLSLDEVTEP